MDTMCTSFQKLQNLVIELNLGRSCSTLYLNICISCAFIYIPQKELAEFVEQSSGQAVEELLSLHKKRYPEGGTHMKKKILSMLMVLALMLGLLPAAAPHAHAEGGNEASVTIDGVTTEYATLEEALETAYFTSVTIDLLTDVTVETTIELFSSENILLRGNGYSITGTGANGTIYNQNANLILDHVHVRNSSGSTTEVVEIRSDGTLTIQNDASVVSEASNAIVNQGTLIITGGTVETYSESKYAIFSENAATRLETSADNDITVTSNNKNALLVMSGSLTIAGDLHMGGVWVTHAYGSEQIADVKVSGALTGDPISVQYDHFNTLDTSDLAMIAPAEGYTITEADAAMIKPQDIDFSSCLGEDGWIWAKYAHVHRSSDEQYQPLDNGKHAFTCTCGETVWEDCEYKQAYNHEHHWLECIHCGYIEPDSMEQHTLQNCKCECGYLGHQADAWTADSDQITHTGTCINCDEFLREEHVGVWGMDDDSHWWTCAKNCGYQEIKGSHGWSEWICRDDQNVHYRQCYCGAFQEEGHTDSDDDLYCEKCEGKVCYDTNDDHKCDDCELWLDDLCTDDNNDHLCDAKLCGKRLEKWCDDEDNNHRCDTAACGRYLRERCRDEDHDWFCDVCRIDLCDHRVTDFVANEDNTHTGICVYCDRSITQPCEFTDGQEWDDSTHWDYCICGRLGNEGPHTYSDVESKTPKGHVLMCNGCDDTISEAHQFVDGVCAVCETEQTALDDVYVGGIGLKSGDYLDLAGNRRSTKPEGGYAHYENGVLTLHNYCYEGDGFLWKEEPSDQLGDVIPYTAALYATTDLILELSGENSLSNMSDTADGTQLDGIAAEQTLTVCGQGALTVLADNDGIHMQGGDMILKEGILYLGVLQEVENDGWIDIAIGDDGIATRDGDVIIEGGDVTINSNDHGMDVNGDVIIRGGSVAVTADDDGLNVEQDIIILNGEVFVEAEDYGLDSDRGSVTIAGGYVDIRAEEWSGIDAENTVEISGGEVYISACDAGISADYVIISGGYMEIEGDWVDVYAVKEITLYVDLPEDAYMEDAGYDVMLGSYETLVIDGTTEKPTPSVGYYDGKILLENIPGGMVVMVVGYTDGQMTELQMVEVVAGDIEVSEDVLACGAGKAFFMNGGFAPIHRGLLID